jgi:Holliday junction resolvase RusA-like endonuclease
MQTIRLTLNKNLEEVFDVLEHELKPLSRTEIIKVALTDIYKKISKNSLAEILSDEEEKSLDLAMKSKMSKVLTTKKDIDNYFKKLDA